MKFKTTLVGGLLTLAIAASAIAFTNGNEDVIVGGQPMMKAKNIIENAVNSSEHTTLVAAVKAAGLVDALQGKGPFTVFAPINDAFMKLPEGIGVLTKPPARSAKLTEPEQS